MADDFRLEAYLARIGYRGPVLADLATLTAIHAAHVDAIAFESLDPFLHRPVDLNLSAVQAKMLDHGRGGYCFEQNALLRAALLAIGFKVTGLGGRVRWRSAPRSPLGPRTHMLLGVDLPDGPFIADAGFGSCLLDAPLRLLAGVEQRTAMGTYRLEAADGHFWLDARQPAGWRTMYAFDLVEQLPSDYDVGNWYTSTHPSAPFPSTLIMERVSRTRRYKLINRSFTVQARDGEVVEVRALASAAELDQVVRDVFAVTPPVSAEQIFARM